MTHRVDVAHGRDVVARWCALAEQRLEYLTELFETGRWRRFHSELAFLENIQEAKTAVETWRGLAMREASRQNSVAVSWQGSTGVAPPRDVLITAETDHVYSDDAPSVPASELALDIDVLAQRYPLLRNAL